MMKKQEDWITVFPSELLKKKTVVQIVKFVCENKTGVLLK